MIQVKKFLSYLNLIGGIAFFLPFFRETILTGFASKDFTFSMAKQLGVSSSLIREKSDLSSSEQLNNANFQRFCFLDDIAMQPL